MDMFAQEVTFSGNEQNRLEKCVQRVDLIVRQDQRHKDFLHHERNYLSFHQHETVVSPRKVIIAAFIEKRVREKNEL